MAAEVEGELGPRNPGNRAFIIGNFMKRMARILQDKPTCFLFTSHLHTSFEGQEYASGGRTKEFMCSVRVKLNKPDVMLLDGADKKTGIHDKDVIGLTLRAKISKNKTAKQRYDDQLVAIREFITPDGELLRLVDEAEELVKIGTKAGIFRNKGGEVYGGAGEIHFNGTKLGSKNAALDVLRGDGELRLTIEKEIREQLWKSISNGKT
jgi:RecA/RadA recombinase